MSRRLGPGALAAALLAVAPTARAYDPGTTHPGLTEQAALASSLSARLKEQHHLALGLWEPLRIRPATDEDKALLRRLALLDPAGGYAPEGGQLPAIGWLLAGSVLEEVPPIRGRNHFYDPSTGRGLDQRRFFGLAARVEAVAAGLGTAGAFFSGAGFDGTGAPSTEWLTSPSNEMGLPRFVEARFRAVAEPTEAGRRQALVMALLDAGALLHVVEDAGDPAHVHNDFQVAMFDLGAPYARWVAGRWGRAAVPPPSGPARSVDHLAQLITAPDGSGLADRTARRFFSHGVLAASAANHGKPVVPGLPPLVADARTNGYVLGEGNRRLARWWRDASGALRWTLDERCFADAAAVLLPETATAALSALEHLFRGSLAFAAGGVRNGTLPLGAGEVALFVESDDGGRRRVAERKVVSAAADEALIELPPPPDRAKRWAAVFRGVDGHGEPIVVSAEADTAPTSPR